VLASVQQNLKVRQGALAKVKQVQSHEPCVLVGAVQERLVKGVVCNMKCRIHIYLVSGTFGLWLRNTNIVGEAIKIADRLFAVALQCTLERDCTHLLMSEVWWGNVLQQGCQFCHCNCPVGSLFSRS
jgi:hypothetical protein